MRLLKDRDYKTFTQLCSLTQQGVLNTMDLFLKKKYDKVITTKDYIIALGDIPIALVAHMDTVFPRPAQNIYYDREKNVMISSEGLGADDRAGVFAIIQIVRRGLRPHIILTTDEEKGGLGALEVALLDCPFEDLRYMIQLDRHGTNDCVFYECDNPRFTQYIENFGFVEAIGSFTDISIIGPEWGVAGVNLSVGYEDEHSMVETLHVGHLLNTIDRVENMLRVKREEIPKFEFIQSKHRAWWKRLPPVAQTIQNAKCHNCGKSLTEDEIIEAKTTDFKWHHYCIDCVPGKVDWCVCCGEAFETPSVGAKLGLCEDCYYDYHYATGSRSY